MRFKNKNIRHGKAFTENSQCSICKKEFLSFAKLAIHVKIVHEDKKIKNPQSRFISPAKKYFQAFHKGKKQKCDKCEKEFSSNKQLLHHVETVHEGKNTKKSSLAEDIESVHKGKKIMSPKSEVHVEKSSSPEIIEPPIGPGPFELTEPPRGSPKLTEPPSGPTELAGPPSGPPELAGSPSGPPKLSGTPGSSPIPDQPDTLMDLSDQSNQTQSSAEKIVNNKDGSYLESSKLTDLILNQSLTPQSSDSKLLPKTDLITHVMVNHCRTAFSYEEKLKNHVAEVHEENKHKSPDCDSELSSKGNLTFHIKTVHGEKKHKCPDCDYELSSKGNLTFHIKTVHGEKKYKCSECNVKLKTESNLMLHMKNIHRGQKIWSQKSDSDSSRNENVSVEQIFQCSICNHKLSSLHTLEVHTMICHEYKCPECYEQLSSKVDLFHHTKTDHNEKKHCCQHCDLKFSLIYTLENHIDNEHKENKMSPKRDTNSSNHEFNGPQPPMNKNIKLLKEQSPMSGDFEPLSGSQDGPLIESPSGIPSALSSGPPEPNGLPSGPAVVDHAPEDSIILQQTDEPMDLLQENVDVEMKETKLEISSDQSNEKPKLTYVQLIEEALVSAPDGMLTFLDICKAISSKHPYYKLLSQNTKLQNWQNSTRNTLVVYSKCFTKVNKTMGGLWQLKENNIVTVHEDIKPFKCEICNAIFRRKQSLKTHIATVHEGKKLFKCALCNANYSHKKNLKLHIENVHENNFSANEDLQTHTGAVDEEKKHNHPKCDSELTEPPCCPLEVTGPPSGPCKLTETPSGPLELTGPSNDPSALASSLGGSSIPQQPNTPMYLSDQSNQLNSSQNVDVQMKELKLEFSLDQCNEKPNLKYAQLIEEALISAPDGMLTFLDIYKAISSKYPYYKMGSPTEVKSWQNSISHNLSIDKCFTKVDKTKGGLWKLTEKNIAKVQDVKKFKCPDCDLELPSKGKLAKHIRNLHGRNFSADVDMEKSSKCGKCGKTFLAISALQRHIVTVHEGKKPFKCDICNANFTQKVALKAHVESVHDGKKYECSDCDAKLSSRSNLVTHIKITHERKEHKCTECGAELASKKKLLYHNKTVHEEEKPKNPIKKTEQAFKCSICNHSLSSFINLEIHNMIFHEYKCPECYEQLSSKVELFHHMKTVHDEKKHCCLHCDLKFSLIYTLENHVEKDHKDMIASMPKFEENEKVTDHVTSAHEKENETSVAEISLTNNLEVDEKNQQSLDNESLREHVRPGHEEKNESSVADPSSTCTLEGPEKNQQFMDCENVKDNVTSFNENKNENLVSTTKFSQEDLDLGLEVHQKTPNYDLWKKILEPYVAV